MEEIYLEEAQEVKIKNPEILPPKQEIHVDQREHKLKSYLNKKENHPLNFVNKYLEIADFRKTAILNTRSAEDIRFLYSMGAFEKAVINLRRINDIRRINKFFETVNEHLPKDGIFVGCVETKAMRKERILKKFPPVLNWMYYIADFIFKRIFPKVPLLKKFYFYVTNGRNRVITSVETLGRLYSCGFKVLDLYKQDKLLFFVAQKVKQPDYNLNPSYGPVFKMKRTGKNGECIHVYKLRTMHPYAEYLQEYIYERNKLCDGGKFNNDIRVTTVGKFCRKVWLDELPMVLNLLNGDLKLVGVRPLSSHYLSLYTDELRQERNKVKPGLIPPFYADMPKTLEEIMDSELRYLKAYQKSPFKTDVSYFCKAFINIIFKRARSK